MYSAKRLIEYIDIKNMIACFCAELSVDFLDLTIIDNFSLLLLQLMLTSILFEGDGHCSHSYICMLSLTTNKIHFSVNCSIQMMGTFQF